MYKLTLKYVENLINLPVFEVVGLGTVIYLVYYKQCMSARTVAFFC